jgi:DNA-directed RNA polymerase subunit RPC12/RpoP
MEADIDFNDGTITLVCSKCGRKYLNQIADTKFGIQIRCECKSVISWRDDLSGVTGYAQSYQRNGEGGSVQRGNLNKAASGPSSLSGSLQRED